MTKPLTPNWILLRGLIRESAHWGDFVPLLQAAFPDSTITTLDLPGTGRWHTQQSPSTITEIVDNLRAQAIKAGILKKPVRLLAISLGGMVAWEWISRYPDDFEGACLINVSFSGLSPWYQRMRWQCLGQVLRVLSQKDPELRELAILQLTSNRRTDKPSIAKAWAAIATLRPISTKNRVRQIIAAARYKPTQYSPKLPVLLLASPNDRLVAFACSEAIQRKWHIPLVSHPNAGHDLPLDDGAWVIKQLQTWLD
jgi:pimeloyl-ACP methyl ester carboxylesterase